MKEDYSHTDWLPQPNRLDLHSHQVDVWRIKLDHPSATVKLLATILSEDEIQRAGRFHFPEDGDRYTIAHGSLRNILARYLKCKPEELNFGINDYGKPTIKVHQLEFNLSHSGGYALIAVTRDHKVGIDVELIRSDMEVESIANRFFSPTETAELMALPSEQRKLAFFNCWTRKEAFIKAQGLGLSLPLASFDVSLTPSEPAILRATRPDAHEASCWSLFSLEVDPKYASALAVEEQEINLRLWDWNAFI